MSHSGDAELANDALEEAAELFRALAEASVDLIRLIEPGGRVVYASPSAIAFLGKYPMHQFENIHPDDLETAQLWWKELLAGSSERLEWRVHDRDGVFHWFETWGTSVQYHGKQGLLTFCRDITERVRTVKELQESQRKLENAEEIAHIGYWENDIAADRINWSEETYRILGLKPGAATPGVATLKSVIHPDDVHIQAEASARAQSGEARYDVEYRIVRPNGEVRSVHSLGDIVREESGKPRRAFGVVQDITELKAAENALRESHGLLNAIIEGTSDAVFAKDTEGRYLMMNAAGARFLGRSVDQIIGRTDHDLFPSYVAEALVDRDREVIASGTSHTFEEEHEVAGATRTYVVTKSAYRDAAGALIGVVGISSDVTDLKRLEKQFRDAQKMEAVGRLAGGIAHDFNNLLTVINSYSEMLLNDLQPDNKDREALSEIRQAGERAANLTRQLLAFSRNQILQPSVVNLNKTLPDLVTLLRRLIGEDVALSFLPGARLGLTRVDPMQLDQAIINLAVNARDAMPGGGRLALETCNEEVHSPKTGGRWDVRPGKYVVISVSDTGHGMNETTKARIFEPFFTTKQAGKGTGLGLAMVYGFVKQSGGHIEIESTPGRGTTFKIYLPRTYEADAGSTKQRSQASPVGTETVLLVEDEDAVRRLSRLILEARGYTVIEARDGQDALSVAKSHKGPIQMLVSDLVMPHLNGRELAQKLAQSRPEMRVLFMSGYTDEEMLPSAVTEARGAFLQKPFSSAELARKVREVLDRPSEPR